MDVRDECSVQAAIENAIGRFDYLDILINNAGITSPGAPLNEQDWDVWTNILTVNLNGVAFGMKHVCRTCSSAVTGGSSTPPPQLAHKPAPNHGAYCASRAAVTALTASVAQEVADRGITVNCVCPGMTQTAMLNVGGGGRGGEAAGSSHQAGCACGRDRLCLVFLASDAAFFFIAQSISPNGGNVMW